MPELPDVEIFKQYLDATSLHKTIEKVAVKNAKILKNVSSEKLSETLTGHSFQATRRHGKYLLVHLDDGPCLVLHFGMTGRLQYFKDLDREPTHSRLLIGFDNGYHLAFVCQRLLGEVSLAQDAESFITEKKLGPDALDLDFSGFQKLFAGRKAAVKSLLMKQQLIAGLGNIYADEVLFQAGVHPETRVNRLVDEQIHQLFNEMKKVLRTAIDCRAAPGQFPSSCLLPHRHKQGTCPRCGRELVRGKVSGRTTYYCPHCQADR